MEEHYIDCPYCGETISVLVDNCCDDQSYYEDCSVCCCPILFEVCLEDGSKKSKINVKREDD